MMLATNTMNQSLSGAYEIRIKEDIKYGVDTLIAAWKLISFSQGLAAHNMGPKRNCCNEGYSNRCIKPQVLILFLFSTDEGQIG